MRKVFRGIQALHPAQEKRAKPLQLGQIEALSDWLDVEIARAIASGKRPAQLRHTRDKALLLLGFWRGFRGDELTRLQVDCIDAVAGEGMTCYLPHTKGDRTGKGTTFKAPALAALCPVDAYLAWTELARMQTGPVFRGIDQWGHVGDSGLHINSLIPLLRSLFNAAGVPFADQYSAHSLRRGFANWASSNGWDVKTLMAYVGWKDVHSAMRYVDGGDPFASLRTAPTLTGSRPLVPE